MIIANPITLKLLIMTFNYKTFTKFKAAYKTATMENKEVFIFEGNEILTAYAKYLIEYLEPKFINPTLN